ncbi:MAG: FAD-dependent oxidoreductase [Inquilinaceae bacterium]
MARFSYPIFSYERPPEATPGHPAARRPVIVVGAGPVGLAAAIDLAGHGIPVLVIDADDTVSVGSRAICWAKRSLEIFDRLGVGGPVVDKGVTWQVGRVFRRDDEVYRFDLLPEGGHKQPAFVNLQQYYVESFLIDRARAMEDITLRFHTRLVGLERRDDGVRLTVETPDGRHALDADYVVAADGARSTARRLLGLDFSGRVFEDRFLIADVRMHADFPAERWFWFDPPFHPGGSALLHSQPDDIWRIDLQLGRDADPEAERQPDRVVPRLRAMLGPDRPFDLEWVSVYTFQCRRLDRFRHGRVIFVGDAAHQVSPFGARGGNSGIQDADNLCWKLAMVLRGAAPETLLDSYDEERGEAADENILHSTRSTDFITPKDPASRALRDAVLDLSAEHPFARALVNSGRLSTPTRYGTSSLSTPDRDRFDAGPQPGAPCPDAPLVDPSGRAGWLLDLLGGRFCLLCFDEPPGDAARFEAMGLAVLSIGADGWTDAQGLAGRRYDARRGTLYLIRPDQHVAARWQTYDAALVETALRRAGGPVGRRVAATVNQ